MQRAKCRLFSFGPTLQNKRSTIFFSQVPNNNERSIKVRGPRIFHRRLVWELRIENPSRRKLMEVWV